MPSAVVPTAPPEPIPDFLLPPEPQPLGRRYALVAALSVLFHVVLLVTIVNTPAQWWQQTTAPVVPIEIRQATPLYVPRELLTQKTPNKGPITHEASIDTLQPKPPQPVAPPKVAAPRPAAPPPAPVIRPSPRPAIAAAPPPPQINAPQRDVAQLGPQGTGTGPALPAAPPPTVEQPKLTFELPGGRGIDQQRPGSLARLAVPKQSINDAIQSVARGQVGGGLVVGDAEDIPDLRMPGQAPSTLPGRIGSNLELLSDPQGIDFKPYLMRVLQVVRRNWFTVIPESVRLGRRGRVTVQFSIDRSGKVPKLVISSPSGAEALDRAAVAGISMSTPLPPLPQDYQGDQVRLQFTFLYNIR